MSVNLEDPGTEAILKAFSGIKADARREAEIDFLAMKLETEEQPKVKEMVNKVDHYNIGNIEVIDALESWDLNFSRSNVIKYLVRAGRKSKETELQDLLKSQYYLNREIERLRR